MEGCYSKYDNPDKVLPTVEVGPLVFAELWHGPTGAFKDLSLTILGRVFDFFLRKRNKQSVVLVSTSGDTGSAAIQSVIGSKRIQLMVMYPRDMISRTQELQMTTRAASNVHVFSVDGNSDDADVVMSTLFADSDFSKKYNLNVFNSLNICRILIQAVHFVYLYLQQCPEVDQDVLFCLPTGGMGNISSGMIARSMGLPIKFMAAVNHNDTIHRTFQSAVFMAPPTVHKTLSCAMDISVPYNMERVLHYLSGERTEEVRKIMNDFEEKGKGNLSPSIIETNTCVSTACVLEQAVLSTMQEVWNKYGYLICPHTAVATRAALDLLTERRNSKDKEEKESAKTAGCYKLVVISTATPAKFSEAVKAAGLSLPPSPKFEDLHMLPERKLYMNKGENWSQIMKKTIEEAWKSF